MIARLTSSAAGFTQTDIEPVRGYRAQDAREFLTAEGLDVDALAPQVDGKLMSAFIRAVKPATENPGVLPSNQSH